MGELEETNRRKAHRGEVQKLILETIKLSGILAVGMVAPNVIKAMHNIGLISGRRQGEIVSSLASRLSKKGLLKFSGKYYELTTEGEKRLRQLELHGYKLTKPKKWDQKWRVIIFDIPEKKRKARTQIRKVFISVGLYRLQDSVWVYPYDCEDIIGLLKTNFGVGREILYMIVEEIENDRYLRGEFGLM